MENETVHIPGARDVIGTVDAPIADAVTVACPPHPEYRGNKDDARLTALAEKLGNNGIATLRFDYGEWDEGNGELTDTRNAIRWADSNFERVSLFGYSFGAGIATMAAADIDVDLEALSVLAPVSTIDDTFNPVEALTSIEIPAQVVYGTRDDTADWEPYVDQARQLGMDVQQYSSDHFFVNQQAKVAETIADFLLQWLLEDPDYHEQTEEL